MSVPAGVFVGDWFEKDIRWREVDKYTLGHLQHQPRHERLNESLNWALANSVKQGLPDVSCYPVLGKVLAQQCLAGRVTHALEVGLLGGYSAIWIAGLNPKIHITSLELDEHCAKVARENLDHAGEDISSRVEIILGSAMDALPKLKEEVLSGKRQPYGFTFIDADKYNNLNYFNYAVEMGYPGSVIYVDNIVTQGTLVREDYDDPELVEGARLVIEGVGKDPRVEAVVQQCVAEKTYDGHIFAVVK